MKYCFYFLIAIYLSVTQGRASDAILTDDTYVSLRTSSKVYGRRPIILVNASARGFVKFNFVTLPNDILPQQIRKATLKLYASSVTRAGTLGLQEQATQWTEGVAPLVPFGQPIGQTALSAASAKTFVTFDVTEAVQKWIADPGSNFGLCLLPLDNSLNVTFDSKESLASSQHPELILFVSPTVTALRARKSSNQNIAGGNADNIVKFDLVETDAYGAYNTTTGVYTFKAPGRYLINVNLHIQDQVWAAGEGRSVEVDNESLHYSTAEVAHSSNISLTGQRIVNVYTGYSIAVHFYVSGAAKILYATPHINRFEIIKIGD